MNFAAVLTLPPNTGSSQQGDLNHVMSAGEGRRANDEAVPVCTLRAGYDIAVTAPIIG